MAFSEALLKKLGVTVSPAKQARAKKDAGHDALFDAVAAAHGLPVPVHEYAFHPTRRWRWDYLFDGWLAVEVCGGAWVRGHHSRGQGQIDDWEKWNEGQIMGYAVLVFTPQQVEDGSAFAVIARALEAHGEQS